MGCIAAIRSRQWLAIAVAAAVMVLAAGGAALVVYGGGRSRPAPGLVADQFLQAVLTDRDRSAAARLVCTGRDLRPLLDEVSAWLKPSVASSWGDVSTTILGRTAVVEATVRFSAPEPGASAPAQFEAIPRYFERWHIVLADEGQWHVCSVSHRPLASSSSTGT